VSVITEVERFILDTITQGKGIESIARDEDLLAKGIVDSHGLMEVIGFLERRYGIAVGDEDLLPENFQSLDRIEEFVRAKGG
jgi:acyl carrier protein